MARLTRVMTLEFVSAIHFRVSTIPHATRTRVRTDTGLFFRHNGSWRSVGAAHRVLRLRWIGWSQGATSDDMGGWVMAQEDAEVLQIWGANWWEAASAFGTLFATLLAVGIALWEGRRAHIAETALAHEREQNAAKARVEVASLVSAWVEVGYQEHPSGNHYVGRSTVTVANESNEPVFDVHVLIGIGRAPVQVGPLAVPVPIPVLPPRRQRSWDISSGLSAFDDGHGGIPEEPVTRIEFQDARQIQWHRNFDGVLRESCAVSDSELDMNIDEGWKQLGDVVNWLNPMGTAIEFLNLIRQEDPPCEPKDIQRLIAPNASGWKSMDAAAIRALKEDLDHYSLAAHCWYRTPRIAYVRLVPAEERPQSVRRIDSAITEPRFLTMVLHAGKGWYVFSVGGQVTTPEWILFPTGSLGGPRVAKGRRSRA